MFVYTRLWNKWNMAVSCGRQCLTLHCSLQKILKGALFFLNRKYVTVSRFVLNSIPQRHEMARYATAVVYVTELWTFNAFDWRCIWLSMHLYFDAFDLLTCPPILGREDDGRLGRRHGGSARVFRSHRRDRRGLRHDGICLELHRETYQLPVQLAIYSAAARYIITPVFRKPHDHGCELKLNFVHTGSNRFYQLGNQVFCCRKKLLCTNMGEIPFLLQPSPYLGTS